LDSVGGSGVDQHSIVSSFTPTDGDIRFLWTQGTVYFIARTAGTTSLVWQAYSATTLTTGVWYHLIASANSATQSIKMYINDTSESLTETVNVLDGLVYWDEANFNVGFSALNDTYVNGCVAELYMTDEYLDLDVEANRRKFISATGAPVSLGADGSTPTGTQPRIYMSGAAANWNAGKNFGSWGDFTVTGALTDCASSPEISASVTTTYSETLGGTTARTSGTFPGDIQSSSTGSLVRYDTPSPASIDATIRITFGSTITVTTFFAKYSRATSASYVLRDGAESVLWSSSDAWASTNVDVQDKAVSTGGISGVKYADLALVRNVTGEFVDVYYFDVA
jgi:hypothetical protein